MNPRKLLFAALAAVTLCAGGAKAHVVGERHVLTTDRSAPLRDAEHRPQVRVTIWYPAMDTAEQRIDLGPPGRPLFEVGAVAPNAAFEDDRARPAILFSHGFGGTARMMAWFGTALARAGYVVIRGPRDEGDAGELFRRVPEIPSANFAAARGNI